MSKSSKEEIENLMGDLKSKIENLFPEDTKADGVGIGIDEAKAANLSKNPEDHDYGKAFDENFDINNPEKEVSEAENAVKDFTDAFDRNKAHVKNFYIELKKAEQLTEERADLDEKIQSASAAERVALNKKATELDNQINDSLKKCKTLYPSYAAGVCEIEYYKSRAEKELKEARAASDKATKDGDPNAPNYAARVSSKDHTMQAYSDMYNSYNNQIEQTAKSLSKIEDNLSKSIEKTKNASQDFGQRQLSAAQAMADPNGNGGLRFLEAEAMAMLATLKTANGVLNTIKANLKKQSLKKSLSQLNEALDGVISDAKADGLSLKNNQRFVEAKEGPDLE